MTEQGKEKLPGFGPLYIETDRAKRLERWAETKRWGKEESGEFTHGRFTKFPISSLETWFEEQSPPWPTRCCTVPIREIFYNSELMYSSILSLIESRHPLTYTTTDRDPDDLYDRAKNPSLAMYSDLWQESHPGLEQALEEDHVPGLNDKVSREGMKFLVYRTAPVSSDVVERFLRSTEQPDHRDGTFKAFGPFSYLFADTGALALGEYEGTATDINDLGHMPPSRFIGKDSAEVGQAWEDLIRPLTERRSLYATRCCVILDDKTAEERDTALVLVAMHMEYLMVRVPFSLLRAGILKTYEMCFLDPDMLEVDKDGVILEAAYGVDAGHD